VTSFFYRFWCWIYYQELILVSVLITESDGQRESIHNTSREKVLILWKKSVHRAKVSTAHGCDWLFSNTGFYFIQQNLRKSRERLWTRQWMQNIRSDGMFTVSIVVHGWRYMAVIAKKKIPHWHALCRSLVFAERSSVKRINARALTSTFGFSFDPVEDAWQCDSASCFWKNCEEWRVGTTRGWDWYIVHNRTNMHLSAQ